MRVLGGIALGALALGVVHCGSDVVVGINATSPAISATPSGGSVDLGPDRSALRAVRRTPGDTHVAGGWIGCTAQRDADCEGWLARVESGIAEEARIDAPGADHVQALALVGDDRIVAGMRTPAGVGGAWLARRTTTGQTWELPLASDASRPSDARAVEIAPDGSIVVGGNESIDPLETGWIARVSADGALTKRVRIGGTPSSSESVVEAIAVIPSGQVFIGGARRQTIDGAATTVPIVLQYSSELTLFNSKTNIGIDATKSGVVRGLLGDRDREITACATADGGVALARLHESLTDDISPRVTRVITDARGRIELGGCAVADDASIVLAGTIDIGGPHPWAAKVDRLTLEPRWTRTFEGERARLEAVAAARGGGAVAVGTSQLRAYSLAIDP